MKLFFHIILILALFTSNAYAASVIRDAEIESVIRKLANPIFEAAELSPNTIKIYIINDQEINAFVSGGQNIFLNTGIISLSDKPDMLTGVIAHETGHIAGGHLARSTDEITKATVKTTLGYLVGMAAIAAGSPAAGQAIAVGSGHVAERQLLKYTRGNEEAADQAALKYLEKTQYSAQGLANLLEILYNQESSSQGKLNPYTLTHPLSRERIAHIKAFITASEKQKKPSSKKLDRDFKRIVVKLNAYLQPPEETLKQFPTSDTSTNARYARSIAYYKIPNIEKSLYEIDNLIKQEPDDPYFNELKGQILFENGKVAQSLPYYEKARYLNAESPLLKIQLATAQISAEDESLLESAISNLKQAINLEADNVFAIHQLAIAYGRSDQLGLSNLSLAEEALIMKNKKEAQKFIKLAEKYIEEGSPAYLRLQDIITSVKNLD